MIYTEKYWLAHESKVRVTYKDTDRMGYSYYGNYPTYYEIGRTEFLREMGLTYKKLEEDGYLLPIVKMIIEYIKPAVYDDLLTIKTIFKKIHQIKVEFDYEIFNSKSELINKGYTLLAFVDINSRKPVRAPQYYIDTLNKFFDLINKQ